MALQSQSVWHGAVRGGGNSLSHSLLHSSLRRHPPSPESWPAHSALWHWYRNLVRSTLHSSTHRRRSLPSTVIPSIHPSIHPFNHPPFLQRVQSLVCECPLVPVHTLRCAREARAARPARRGNQPLIHFRIHIHTHRCFAHTHTSAIDKSVPCFTPLPVLLLPSPRIRLVCFDSEMHDAPR
ncbi:hypothetical protein JMJ77_0005382 [Colletotrichum scovillei]|uniref:Uncharacterized protein n=1 Tax=Colletotrichum scovillei TaxID=1209932 RepID=A0A9P7UIP4_9PEZI|nr:hypothetical protein JMJ77_0005382 [Colletotrichum scovillei]KAG7076599.1 hypothetical protein JMJ76_0013861 [Colletotrichum scovillei]KAG7083707.1 hypothetical protein JMJ78_0009150 [Colletotrichum scovillei]